MPGYDKANLSTPRIDYSAGPGNWYGVLFFMANKLKERVTAGGGEFQVDIINHVFDKSMISIAAQDADKLVLLHLTRSELIELIEKLKKVAETLPKD